MAGGFVLAATLLLTTLVHWARAQGCSSTNAVLASNQVYTLTSINFPYPYPATTSYYCTFTGTAPADHKVFLQCDSFDVVYSPQCNLAWFVFSASGDAQFTDGIRYCGYYQTLSLQTTGNQFAAAFVNDYFLENNPYTGYRCYVVAIPNTPTTLASTPTAPTTKAPTTPASTTPAPTTKAPTTRVSTTPALTTKAPTTRASTTPAPTTKAPTTRASTTSAPTTKAPTTRASTTPAPTTKAPTTRASSTSAPTTKAPTTRASTTPAPTTKAPTTRVSTTPALTTKAPTTRASTTPALTTKAPTTRASNTPAPTTKAPTTRASTTYAPTTKAPTTRASTSPAPTTKAPTTRVSTTPNPTTKAPTTPPSTCTCGIKNSGFRIVGGQATTVHEYPWMVALEGKTTGTPYCGGTLIDNQWVLTASHCLAGFQASDIIIRLGEHQMSSTTETNQTISRNVAQIIVHENYNDVTVDNDIGLVKLSSPVTYSRQINPACLPLRFPTTQDFNGKNATVTGWGTTAYQGFVSDILQEITLPVLGNSQCNQTFPSVAGKLTSNMFCTYAVGKDSCQGDSGGPLVYEETGRNYLIGVVSWGIKCAENGNPGVYAKVNNYLDWIKQKTGVTFCNV